MNLFFLLSCVPEISLKFVFIRVNSWLEISYG